MIRAIRVGNEPIIHQGLCPTLGDNINGPSLIARPDWAPGPGRYLLYFAHHMGRHIRMATADRLEGPWSIYTPGVLPLADTDLAQTRPDTTQPAWAEAAGVDGLYPHLASPDVWADEETKRLRMLFHGLAEDGEQVTYAATSANGLNWQVEGPPLAETYLRRFSHVGQDYALARLGMLLKARPDGTWEIGPKAVPGEIRHVAVLVQSEMLHVLFSRIGEAPERIQHVSVPLHGDWLNWQAEDTETDLLVPELDWEGAREPLSPSLPGATGFVRELRDPCLFVEDDRVWLIYTGGGEHALGLARIEGL